ncbi:hypothetical protein [Okeania sp.]|nr:hypothetical protein [Okeania sp.]MEB3339432.1 hypothetical protein [Okeania sp.]
MDSKVRIKAKFEESDRFLTRGDRSLARLTTRYWEASGKVVW